MRAPVLVDLLLEMNVLNPRDYERRVDILAADINNEVLAQWFTRSTKYVIQNMDELTKRSHRPVPKEWLNATGIHGTPHPFTDVDPEDLPATGSKELLTALSSRGGHHNRPAWWQKEPAIAKTVTPSYAMPGEENAYREKADRLRSTGRLDPIPQADWERWQSQRGEMEKEQAQRFAGAKPYKPKRTKKAKSAVAEALFEADPQSLVGGAFKALKAAVDKKDEPDNVQRALNAFMAEAGIDGEEVSQALQSRHPESALVHLVQGIVDRPPQVVVQALRAAADQLTSYSTKLHQPHWQKQIGQEFSRFTPKATGPGLPFTAPSQAPEWMAKRAAQGEEPEAYHFDPLRTQDREFWSGLEAVVSYLNYLDYASTSLGDSDNAEERADAQKGAELLRRLDKGKAADFDLFLNVYTAAKEFEDNIPRALMRHSAKLIARDGNLELYQLTAGEAVHDFSNRPTPYNTSSSPKKNDQGETIPGWCTTGISQANSYLGYADGVMYGVLKNGAPYVLMSPGSQSGEFKAATNTRVTTDMVHELLPLLARMPDEKLNKLEYPGTLELVQQYRQEQGQQAR